MLYFSLEWIFLVIGHLPNGTVGQVLKNQKNLFPQSRLLVQYPISFPFLRATNWVVMDIYYEDADWSGFATEKVEIMECLVY